MAGQIGQTFMEMTKFGHSRPSDQMKGLSPPPLELPCDPAIPRIDLPRPENIRFGDTPLREAIEGRKSVRAYAKKPLTEGELSYLLWCTQGVKEVFLRSATLRTVPSAGARHALETYILINRVANLRSGLYRFLASEHRLAVLDTDAGIAAEMTAACLGQDMVKRSAVTFIWTAVPYRMTWRYGERGYRYLHLDAGHVCQNLYLAAQTIDSGVCAIGAFSDDDMNRLLGLDGTEQFVIYLAAVGKKS